MKGKSETRKELVNKFRDSHFYPTDNRGARKGLQQEAHVVKSEF